MHISKLIGIINNDLDVLIFHIFYENPCHLASNVCLSYRLI